jgi:hypothetical protein
MQQQTIPHKADWLDMINRMEALEERLEAQVTSQDAIESVARAYALATLFTVRYQTSLVIQFSPGDSSYIVHPLLQGHQAIITHAPDLYDAVVTIITEYMNSQDFLLDQLEKLGIPM